MKNTLIKMKTKTVIPILVIVVLIIILIVSQTSASVKEINSDEFEQLIISEEVFVINAHTPYVGEILGTDLNAENWENMESYLDQLPEDKESPIAIYCRSGRMSGISAQELLDLGYTNIYDLSGGMNAWQKSGRSLVQNIEETGETKEFNIIASNWNFLPNIMEVNLGDNVVLHVKSVEGNHGIALFDFNVNEHLTQGETIDIEFLANKQGTFNFFCNVPCGSGHGGMGGQLIVNWDG